MATNEKDQPGRSKPNESENQPQFASADEARRGPELGGSEDDDTDNKVSAGSALPAADDQDRNDDRKDDRKDAPDDEARRRRGDG